MSFHFFSELVPELQHEVLRQCDARSLSVLGIYIPQSRSRAVRAESDKARTTKTMHNYAIPLLYRHVDISCHNEPGTHLSHTRRQVGPEHPGRRLGQRYGRFQIRQQVLIDTLHKYPVYGKYTEELTFTYFDFLDVQNDQRADMRPLWSAFRLMSGAKVVDFASFATKGGLRHPYVCFPNVEHLRLSGPMAFSFVKMFMGFALPTKLISLELNNLQNVGQLSEGRNLPRYTFLNLVPETGDCHHPGPMRGHLKPLEGQCPNLQFLRLRSVGQDYDDDCFWSLSRDLNRYNEWATFINSVKSTLISLTIEQGTGPGETYTQNVDVRATPQVGTPMDRRFFYSIYRTLVNGPWPALEYMELLGLGAVPRDHVRNYEPRSIHVAMEHLAFELGPRVFLLVDIQVRRTFYERIAGNTYESPPGS